MWFSVKSSKSSTTVQPILQEGTPLANVSKQKYLGITIDSNLTWAYHVADVCKKMAYYLYLIGCHQKVLPDNNIIKMLIDLLVFSHFVYSLPVWSPSLNVSLLHCIIRLHNCGIRITSGLCKYDHVSHYRFALGWLPVGSVIQHHLLVAMYKQFRCIHCLLLGPPIEFG